MASTGQNIATSSGEGHGIVAAEANSGKPSRGDIEAMARRRFQNPVPKREGNWWYVLYWVDTFSDGKCTRKRQRHKLAPGDIPEREAKKMAAEFLRPMNQGLAPIGSATEFEEYVETVYRSTLLPLLAKGTRDRYEGVIKNYLMPAFGSKCLRDLTPLTLQQYFSGMTKWHLSYESRDKIRDVMSSILGSAVTYGLLVKNPVEGVRLSPGKKGKRIKPYIKRLRHARICRGVPESAGDAACGTEPRSAGRQRDRWTHHAACWICPQSEKEEAHRRVLRLAEDDCPNAQGAPSRSLQSALDFCSGLRRLQSGAHAKSGRRSSGGVSPGRSVSFGAPS
jgi:Phage integrase, N-terminal SAM-like domain